MSDFVPIALVTKRMRVVLPQGGKVIEGLEEKYAVYAFKNNGSDDDTNPFKESDSSGKLLEDPIILSEKVMRSVSLVSEGMRVSLRASLQKLGYCDGEIKQIVHDRYLKHSIARLTQAQAADLHVDLALGRIAPRSEGMSTAYRLVRE